MSYNKHNQKKTSAGLNGKIALCTIKKGLKNHFLLLGRQLNQIEDTRKRRTYSVEEPVMAGILLFLFRQKSRNEMDNHRLDEQFAGNYCR